MSLSLNSVLVRYDEIALKSRSVRRRLEDLLISRLEEAMRYDGVDFEAVRRYAGRIVVFCDSGEQAAESTARVFGVVSTSPTEIRDVTFDKAVDLLGRVGGELLEGGKSFAIRSRRVGNHDFTSIDLAEEAGAQVQRRTSATVDLDDPDVELFVEIRGDTGFFFLEKVQGPGGLPLGSQGKMVALVSGGIDSPVATWSMMRRGAEAVPVFFDNAPFTDGTTRSRAMGSIEDLASWAHRPLESYVVPHGRALEAILKKADRKLTCVLCRRMMYRVGERIAELMGCDGIVTGESLGQVASQTHSNLKTEDEVTSLPVYRPLIGMDKREIIDRAREIGTYDTSTAPATCCTITPDRPSTVASIEEVEESEAEVDIEALVEEAVSGAKVRKIG